MYWKICTQLHCWCGSLNYDQPKLAPGFCLIPLLLGDTFWTWISAGIVIYSSEEFGLHIAERQIKSQYCVCVWVVPSGFCRVFFFSSFCSTDSFMKKDDEIQASDGISITQELKYSEQARTCIKINTQTQSERKYFKYRKILQLVPRATYPADLLLWIYGCCHNTFFSGFSRKRAFSRTKSNS